MVSIPTLTLMLLHTIAGAQRQPVPAVMLSIDGKEINLRLPQLTLATVRGGRSAVRVQAQLDQSPVPLTIEVQFAGEKAGDYDLVDNYRAEDMSHRDHGSLKIMGDQKQAIPTLFAAGGTLKVESCTAEPDGTIPAAVISFDGSLLDAAKGQHPVKLRIEWGQK